MNEIIIGVMADSHDNLESIEKAVKVFNQEQVDLVLLAGDLIQSVVELVSAVELGFRQLDLVP